MIKAFAIRNKKIEKNKEVRAKIRTKTEEANRTKIPELWKNGR